MKVSKGTLLNHGWRPIVSDAQAAQLLRRELKHQMKQEQRGKDLHLSRKDLLALKPGNWFKIIHNPRWHSIRVWRFQND